jgi:hypothetical protein
MSNVITSGPAAGSFTAVGSDVRAVITWQTEVGSNGKVDYGPTAAYGLSTAYEPFNTLYHSLSLTNLTNHATNHYRVRFKDSFNNEVVSGDYTFYIAIPPSVSLPSSPASGSTIVSATAVDTTLQWNASTDPDGAAGQLQYLVEIDTSNPPVSSSPNYKSSGWLTGIAGTNSWTVSALATDTAWFWRIKAKHLDAEANWSGVSYFNLSSVEPPVAPTLIPPYPSGSYDSGCSNTPVTVAWNPVTSPDGDPVQYRVFTDVYGDSGWLPAGQTSWIFTNHAGWGLSWWVKARDANHITSESPNSASNYFYDVGSACYGSSCPLVFSWDGTAYNYVTDLQGPVIGSDPATIRKDPRMYQPTYAVLDELKQDETGAYRVKVRESMPEITYLDKSSLLIVDVPEGHQIGASASENTYNYGYLNPFKIYTLRDSRSPISATDRDGSNVLPSVLTVDNVPAPVLFNPPSPDFYTFDFGPVLHPEHAKLVIDGWSVYSIARYKSSVTIQPFIEVADQNGNWVKVKSFGTPAGDLKTMVIDIANIFLSNDHRIRLNLGIRRGSRWMIDRIRLDDSIPVTATVQEVSSSSADLQLGGHAIHTMGSLQSRLIASDVNMPLIQESLGYGKFTKYGEVAELLTERDDKYVIMRHGDKIDLAFPSPSNVPDGFVRRFILKASLFYKNFEVAKTVEPLPFKDMSVYPYELPEAYPTDEDHQQYLLEYITREFNQ